jgi:hypothetical protein
VTQKERKNIEHALLHLRAKTSKALKQDRQKWERKRVQYYLHTLRRDGRLDGPFTGVVEGLSNDAAMIEDRLENKDGRNRPVFTGTLFVVDDETGRVEWAPVEHCTIIEPNDTLQGSPEAKRKEIP